MITKSYLRKLATMGFSIIPVAEDKTPIGAWKKRQENPRTPDEVDQLDSPKYGLLTGVDGLECVDVDLKVIVGLQEQKKWFDEYIQFIEDNIEDFKDKVVIAKTKNAGFHILYKCTTIQGNTKIAKMKGMNEAILESRGKGGMVVMYDDFITEKKYHDIQYITENERELIWSISKTYNHIDESTIDQPVKHEYTPTTETDISPWQDYNDKHTALDLIRDEFSIVRNTTKNYIIKREGATSPHSGYVYKDSGCMYLFSTGTQYPAEKLLSPFSIYAYKYHFGDYSKAASELYREGYGTRRIQNISIPPPKKEKIEKDPPLTRQKFPVDIFPETIQHFIKESTDTLGLSSDYMGCSFLWMLSLIVGNTMVIEVKPGWKEVATLWIAVVGKPGIGKTPSITQMIQPLRIMNVKEQKDFQRKMAQFVEYEKLEKKEKQYAEEIDRPVNKQFIVGDVTLEALIDIHEENPNAIGVFKDELAGWFKDMNKYRAGSDLEFWLSSWSGASISVNRKTAKSAFVDKPFIPVLGGIQPSIFEEFTNGNNKENGFVDRILISYPELTVNKYNKAHIDSYIIQWYNDFVCKFKSDIHKLFLKMDDNGEINSTVVRFNRESEQQWIRIHDKITDIQNSDDENEYMKSMLPKQKSYIPRFALLINVLWSYVDNSYAFDSIHKESILRAERLSEYFVNMAKLVKKDSKEKNDLRKSANGADTPFDKFKAMYLTDPELNRTTASEILEVSRKTIHRWIEKIEQ